MSYQIGQGFEFIGRGYWRWWSWIDADDAELDEVRDVAWLLHPSFKTTRVVVKDRSSRFRLDSGGWGTFLLRAQITMRDGQKKTIQRYLRLEYPDDADPGALEKLEHPEIPAKPFKVFLSYGQQDARMAKKLRDGLASEGIDVLDQSRIEPDAPLNDSVRRMISKADAVVGLFGEDDVSPFVISELKFAAASAKPSFVLLPEGKGSGEVPDKAKKVHFEIDGPHASILAGLLREVGAQS